MKAQTLNRQKQAEQQHVAERPEISGSSGRVVPIGRRFQPGQSGNPGGRPKVIAELRDLARLHTLEAIETLVRVMRDRRASAAARVAAACAILDRGYGRPSQELAISRDDMVVLLDVCLERHCGSLIKDDATD
jgi:hypothetical protein